jgi:hypothetical protein
MNPKDPQAGRTITDKNPTALIITTTAVPQIYGSLLQCSECHQSLCLLTNERHAKENVEMQQNIRHGQIDNVLNRKQQDLLLQKPACPDQLAKPSQSSD